MTLEQLLGGRPGARCTAFLVYLTTPAGVQALGYARTSSWVH